MNTSFLIWRRRRGYPPTPTANQVPPYEPREHIPRRFVENTHGMNGMDGTGFPPNYRNIIPHQPIVRNLPRVRKNWKSTTDVQNIPAVTVASIAGK